MKERPVLFSGPMVRAIMDGRKTQTRRIVTTRDAVNLGPLSVRSVADFVTHTWATFSDGDPLCDYSARCPYGKPGDRLWVRETWAPVNALRTSDPGTYALACGAFYSADYASGLSHSDGTDLRWRPSIHMPRALSRIDLEVTSVRVQKLQDISDEDAGAEGVFLRYGTGEDGCRCFACLWDKINGERAPWKENPWVWAIGFKVVRGKA